MAEQTIEDGAIPLDVLGNRKQRNRRFVVSSLSAILMAALSCLFAFNAIFGIRPGKAAESDNPAIVVLGVLVALAFCLLFGFLAITLVRNAVAARRGFAYLKDNVLTVRNDFAPRLFDLSVDDVWIKRHGLALTMRLRNSAGKKVSLPLTPFGKQLPPHQLTALADAIAAGQRTESAQKQANAAITTLRTLSSSAPSI